MLQQSYPPVFLEQPDDSLCKAKAAQKFNAEIYENLLKIEFNLSHISKIVGGKGVVPIRDELLRKLDSNNNELKQVILDSIRNSDYVFDLNYSDAENPELDCIEGYTSPKPNNELLKIAGIYEEVILILTQKFVENLDSKRENKAEEVITKNPNLFLDLYKLIPDERRNRLIDRLMFGACTHFDLVSLEEFQRQFILGFAGVYGLLNKKFDTAWVQSQSQETLKFMSEIEVLGNVVQKGLPLQTVVRIFQKFGRRNTFAILKHGVDTEDELLAFETLSPQEFSTAVRIAKSVDLDSLDLNKVGIIKTIKTNPKFFSRNVCNKAAKYAAELGYEYEKLVNSADEVMHLYFTSPSTIQIIKAIGVRHTHSLYLNHFETFSALYSQGEWFLCNYKSEIRNLMNMHLDDRLYPHSHTCVSRTKRIDFHIQTLILQKENNIPPSPPVRIDSCIIRQ